MRKKGRKGRNGEEKEGTRRDSGIRISIEGDEERNRMAMKERKEQRMGGEEEMVIMGCRDEGAVKEGYGNRGQRRKVKEKKERYRELGK